MSDRVSRSVRWPERAVIVIVGLVVVVLGGVASVATIAAPFSGSLVPAGHSVEAGTVAAVYLWGGVCTVLTAIVLLWLLPAWWRGRQSTGAFAGTLISMMAWFVCWCLWFMYAAVLGSN
jgi:hypothetical protein